MIAIFKDEIYSFAEEAVGRADSEGTLSALCEAASAELMGRLREGTDVESIKPLFVTAAGVLALSMYIALGGDATESFRAGNLAVTIGGERASAHVLRQQAESMLCAYMADRGFDFRSVEG